MAKMTPIPDYGDVMFLDEFITDCIDGCLIDYDGFGHYSDGKLMSDIVVNPSDVDAGEIKKEWTHVVWFNR